MKSEGIRYKIDAALKNDLPLAGTSFTGNTDSLSKTVFSVEPLFKRFESVFSRGALRSEKTDL